jgi:hypothetical protein
MTEKEKLVEKIRDACNKKGFFVIPIKYGEYICDEYGYETITDLVLSEYVSKKRMILYLRTIQYQIEHTKDPDYNVVEDIEKYIINNLQKQD